LKNIPHDLELRENGPDSRYIILLATNLRRQGDCARFDSIFTAAFGERMSETARRSSGRLLIVGCGNPDAGDDSVGLEIVRRLGEHGDCGCDLRAETAPGVELLELFPLADVILFVDAVVSGGAPGTLYLTSLPAKELEPQALGSLSSHGWGVGEVVKLADALGRPTPRLYLLGIEAGAVAVGAARSDAVEEAIALVVERVAALKLLLLTSEVLSTRSFPPDNDSFPGPAA
jgi:hydrogenase maturation protease